VVAASTLKLPPTDQLPGPEGAEGSVEHHDNDDHEVIRHDRAFPPGVKLRIEMVRREFNAAPPGPDGRVFDIKGTGASRWFESPVPWLFASASETGLAPTGLLWNLLA
jgi:hypothetical protein